MFVYNNCRHDAWVLKEAKMLTEAGLPVVSSNFPAFRGVVGGMGWSIFDPKALESIAEAINRVLASKRRYDTMKLNTLQAARIFSGETESRKLLEIY